MYIASETLGEMGSGIRIKGIRGRWVVIVGPELLKMYPESRIRIF